MGICGSCDDMNLYYEQKDDFEQVSVEDWETVELETKGTA